MSHGLGGFGIELVVQGNSPEIVEPGERPFDDPPQQDDIELLGTFVGSEHDLKLAAKHPSHLLLQLVVPGSPLLQPRELVGESGQGRFCAFAFVDVPLSIVLRLDESSKKLSVIPKRWIVECSFVWLENFRRVSLDNEFFFESSLAMHQIAFSVIMLKKQFCKIKTAPYY
jgi:hypothetical protein